MDKKPGLHKCQSEFIEDGRSAKIWLEKIVCEKRECESFNK